MISVSIDDAKLTIHGLDLATTQVILDLIEFRNGGGMHHKERICGMDQIECHAWDALTDDLYIVDISSHNVEIDEVRDGFRFEDTYIDNDHNIMAALVRKL